MIEDQYHAIRQQLAALLRRDAALHKLGQYQKIGADFLGVQSQLQHGGDKRYRKLIVALKFWDAWILARNTDWMEHMNVNEEDWPRLAECVVADLDADREITEQEVLDSFDLTTTLPLPHAGPRRRPRS